MHTRPWTLWGGRAGTQRGTPPMQAKLRCAYRLQLFDLPVSIFCEKINQEKAGIEMFYKEAISLIFILFFYLLVYLFHHCWNFEFEFHFIWKRKFIKNFSAFRAQRPTAESRCTIFFTYFFLQFPRFSILCLNESLFDISTFYFCKILVIFLLNKLRCLVF